ncbi:hypothetical protein BCR44DRAFT_1084443 [Catenaria anguillulae PL171]|uniref:Uncharacterized protein n=1 Tax=Catenaria anguillulae PL171 TaxID=765915 RepID=A0A1Y2HQH1_9FUNG|nr:hypothetical protein BCR44DRAFT_1084443 [Catenaria anguillulae PL171]
MGPTLNATQVAAAGATDVQGSLTTDPLANGAVPVIPAYQLQFMAFFTALANWLLPVLDHIDFARGWLEGLVFGPKSAPVRQGTAIDAVVLTGASTGIGYDAALTLAKRGIVVFAGVRSQKDLDRLSDLGVSTLIPIQLDVASPQSIRNAVAEVSSILEARDGTVQLVGVVNNAGIPHSSTMDTTTRDAIERVFDVNVFGALEVTQAFLPLIRQHGRGGRVVVIGSVAGIATVPLNGVYSASKKAVEGLFEGLRLEIASEGIHVSIIRPGSIGTPLWNKFTDDTSAKGRKFAELAKTIGHASGIAPSHVTRSILHALTSTYPLHYYAVGLDARAIFALISKVPSRLYDLVLRSAMLKD